jgi:membrane protein YqaA with SNARE-associated domain
VITKPTKSRLRRRREWRNYIVGVISIAVTVGICLLAVFNWQEFLNLSKYGYIRIFGISLLAGIVVFVPVPSTLLVFTLGAVLNPVLIGLVAGAGETIGSMGAYVTGYSSMSAFHTMDNEVMDNFRKWLKTRGALSVFAMSAIFNPLFYPFTAIAGMMHFGWWRFLMLCMAGKTVKNMLVAYTGLLGITIIFEIMGIKLPL